MATPPGGRPYDGGAQPPSGEHSHHGYPFPSTPGREGDHLSSHPQHQQPQQYHQQYPPQQPYDPGYGGRQQPAHPHQPSHHQQQYQEQQRYQQPSGRRRPPPPSPSQGGPNPLVRPYAMTGGRTRPRYQLAIEALVSTTADPMRLQGQLPEHQRICRLCFEIKSVAEISALLSIPLGVARILVADLAEAGLVAIHQPGGDEAAGGQPDVTLLERVLSGLRKL
ncbi:DUF742 domain-containing protein [Streptomyces sp. NPDC020412]|uniref:DUF742 domain-containing protein n=1 Tax=Streptomyces sp. NPDC020412 TaxID=3365073 RepID=UPI003797B36E